MTKVIAVFRLGFVCLMAAALLAPPGVVSAKSVSWDRFDVDITVNTDGSLRIVETQVIRFEGGPFTSGFAVIPQEGGDGITDIVVSEPDQYYAESGGQFDHTYTWYYDDNGDLVVEWYFPPVSNAARTYLLSYTVTGAVRQYDSGDKIRVAAIGPDFEFPIAASTVTVHLPPGGDLIDDPDSIGAPVEWVTGLDNRTVTFTTTRGVNPQEGIGIELTFRHGAITAPKPAWQAEQDFKDNTSPIVNLVIWAVTIALFLAVPGVLYLVWFLFGRDPSAALAPDYLPDPPSKLAPGLAGVLIDEKADMRDITATLVDLARRGVLTFEEGEAQGSFGATSKSYTLRKAPAPPPMAPFEKMIYDAVFGSTDVVKLNYMRDGFFTALPRIEHEMYQQVVSEGLFRTNPESARGQYRGLGILLVAASIFGGCALTVFFADLFEAVLCLPVPIIALGLGLVALSGAMPARTRKGADEAAKWRAFQKYLGNIQKYKDVSHAADQFEKYLPYAVAFGLERRWVNAFAQAPVAASIPVPTWYRPYHRPIGVPTAQPGGPATPAGVGPAPSAPSLNQMGEGMAGGLNSIGESFAGALNAAGRALTTRNPASTYSYSGGGSRGYSGGRSTFRSGGSFRSGGFSGGGRRGFR